MGAGIVDMLGDVEWRRNLELVRKSRRDKKRRSLKRKSGEWSSQPLCFNNLVKSLAQRDRRCLRGQKRCEEEKTA